MNKIKKIFTSFGVFFTSMVSKVLAFDPATMVQDKYGVIEPEMYEPTMGEKILGIEKIALLLAFFIIGLFVVLNKKITKKAKIITISILLTVEIIGWIVLNLLQTIMGKR